MGLDITLKTSKSEKYFRKVNFLIPFVESKIGHALEDCEVAKLTKADLEVLVERCKEVLDDHSKATAILPTCGGFFFGSTEYDDWYFQDVEEVRDQVSDLLSTMTDRMKASFSAWW
jgi:hypothetical protein